jgi:hypothetical protein
VCGAEDHRLAAVRADWLLVRPVLTQHRFAAWPVGVITVVMRRLVAVTKAIHELLRRLLRQGLRIGEALI